jgi:hypothetical protein
MHSMRAVTRIGYGAGISGKREECWRDFRLDRRSGLPWEQSLGIPRDRLWYLEPLRILALDGVLETRIVEAREVAQPFQVAPLIIEKGDTAGPLVGGGGVP